MPIATPQLQLETESLCAMLEEWPTDSYAAHSSRIAPAALHSQRLEQARTILSLPNDRIRLVREHGELVGAACWSPLPWDSRHFGFAAGRIDVLLAGGDYRQSRHRKQHLLGSLLEECRLQGLQHLSVRTQAADLASIHALQRHGFEWIDGIQTFTLSLVEGIAEVSPVPTGIRIGEYEPWQLEGILEIAGSAYRFDRFHSDPALPTGAADRLHEDWLLNSCSGKAADMVVVATDERQVLGFVTVKFDSAIYCRNGGRLATIVLVATAERGRGQGIGKATTLATLSLLRKHNIAAVQVGTQLSNIGAGRLYESCGFRLGASTLTFRKLIS